MNIFEAIVKNNVDLVKELIDRKISSKDELEPEFFMGKNIKYIGNSNGKGPKEFLQIKRKKRRTALQLAAYLKRYEIVDALVN